MTTVPPSTANSPRGKDEEPGMAVDIHPHWSRRPPPGGDSAGGRPVVQLPEGPGNPAPAEDWASRVANALTRTPSLSGHHATSDETTGAVFSLRDVRVRYGSATAMHGVSFDIPPREITAIIGPSGCGKSTLLRCLNRMNDLVPGASVEGSILYNGEDLYGQDVDPVEVRRRIGMVFQKPNPFPKSIYDNVAFGPRLHGDVRDLDDDVEQALRAAALWDEVKDKLGSNALSLSGGQQQRLCIARALAVEPDVILMDEPCSALDPIATLRIEDLMRSLRDRYTIVIVTHNMQQAARVSDLTAFLTVEVDAASAERSGLLVEFDITERIFTQAADPRTEAYITGRFG